MLNFIYSIPNWIGYLLVGLLAFVCAFLLIRIVYKIGSTFYDILNDKRLDKTKNLWYNLITKKERRIYIWILYLFLVLYRVFYSYF